MAVIIYPKTMNWSYMKQRPQQLMTQLGSLGHQVYFENLAPMDREFQEVEPNVYLFTDTKAFLHRKLPELRKQHPVVVWTTWSKLRTRIATVFNPDVTIYDCCDEFPQWAKYEHKMVQAADHVVCTAETIHARLSLAYPEKPITLIPNGADDAFFRIPDGERPGDLPPGPVVAYIGAWAYWVDHALFAKLAARFPGVQFISIGAPYGTSADYSQLPNVFILGEKPHHELKRYLPHIDVALIPFQYHPITLATNPVKAYEYLAAGVRVLSTALPECILMEPHVTTATTHEDYIAKLAAMLSEQDSAERRQARIAYARQHRWVERGIAADQVIRQALEARGSRFP
ncbi:glycosyl transferase family 1 [Paenibacillus campinasensis]|uniref:Glycosyl transferase family 1 n=1 Tax=Paenibacillus campinasensis TaxID=66347 RepID=A0A268ERJ3_9BACL|nr:glycosyl transferase family 1 [Paenibacillus campinasensis]PAD75724.1 glycosyl transferase family 1 [Paenibacillus campinasensis]